MSNNSASTQAFSTQQPARNTTLNEIRKGFIDSLAAGFGIFPLGIALGMLVVETGLPWWVAPLLSALVFAGSVEFMIVALVTNGASNFTVALTTLAVNFRHVFYAFSFPLHRVKPGFSKAYSIFGLIDEAYATYAGKNPDELSSARIVSMQLISQLYWVLGGLFGVTIANLLPFPLQGFEFALCALFTVLTIDAFTGKEAVPSLLLAVCAFTIATACSPTDSVLLVALLIFAALLVIRYLVYARRAATSEIAPQTTNFNRSVNFDRESI